MITTISIITRHACARYPDLKPAAAVEKYADDLLQEISEKSTQPEALLADDIELCFTVYSVAATLKEKEMKCTGTSM
jgi:hypothetical protein